jgi:hypothetical protein
MRQQPFIVVGTADRYGLNTMNLVARDDRFDLRQKIQPVSA